jgi:hypothetical protein
MRRVNSEVFSTTVQPAASGGAIFQALVTSGKFHGTIMPTGPTGSKRVRPAKAGSGIGTGSPWRASSPSASPA